MTWEDANINGSYGMSPSGRTPTDILSSASVLKGPNALIAGMAPGGSIGGVVMATTKRADRDLTQVSAMYEDGGIINLALMLLAVLVKIKSLVLE